MKVKIKAIRFDIVWTAGLMHSHASWDLKGSGTFSCCLQDRWEDTLLFRASSGKAKDAKQQEALAMSEAFRVQFVAICGIHLKHFEAL